jgi:hypothetical protein
MGWWQQINSREPPLSDNTATSLPHTSQRYTANTASMGSMGWLQQWGSNAWLAARITMTRAPHSLQR